jgi:hypothetical protein
MRRYWVIAVLVLLGLSSIEIVLVPQAREPVYAGKTVSHWLDAGYEDASMAVQEIGPAAVPFVLAKLAREDPRYGSSRRYRQIWRMLPRGLRDIVPKPNAANFDELRACSTLLELGPPIVPFLTNGLAHHNTAVRKTCARALGYLRARGQDIRSAFPALKAALQDPNAEVRAAAVWAMGPRDTPLARL